MAGQSLNSTKTIKMNISNSKSKMIPQSYQKKRHLIEKWESYNTILINLQPTKLRVHLIITASFMNRIKSNNLKSSMQQETLELMLELSQFKNNKAALTITITQSWKAQSPAKLIRWWITNPNCHQISNRCSPPWVTLAFPITSIQKARNQLWNSDKPTRVNSLLLTRYKEWWTRRIIGEWGPRPLTRYCMISRIELRLTQSMWWASRRSWWISFCNCSPTKTSRLCWIRWTSWTWYLACRSSASDMWR